MPGHSTSDWRPTIVNSHTRVSCLRPRHKFHRGASHQERWRLDQTHSYVKMLYVLSWEWPTCCPGIACYLDEEHHMSVCIVMCVFPHDEPGHCVFLRREASRAHNLNIKWPLQGGQFNFRFGAIWQHEFGSPREPPYKRSRMIRFLCPGIARHIGVQELSIHIQGFHV